MHWKNAILGSGQLFLCWLIVLPPGAPTEVLVNVQLSLYWLPLATDAAQSWETMTWKWQLSEELTTVHHKVVLTSII